MLRVKELQTKELKLHLEQKEDSLKSNGDEFWAKVSTPEMKK